MKFIDAPVEIDASEPDSPLAISAPAHKPRYRQITNSPDREWANREGSIQPLRQDLIAALSNLSGTKQIDGSGISIKNDELGGRRRYNSESSVTLIPANVGRKINWTISTQLPEVIHLFDDSWNYIESVAQIEFGDFLDTKAMRKQAALKRTAMHQTISHLEMIHGQDNLDRMERDRRDVKRFKAIREVTKSFDPPTDAPEVADRRAEIPSDSAPLTSLTAAGREQITAHRDRQTTLADHGDRHIPDDAFLDSPTSDRFQPSPVLLGNEDDDLELDEFM